MDTARTARKSLKRLQDNVNGIESDDHASAWEKTKDALGRAHQACADHCGRLAAEKDTNEAYDRTGRTDLGKL